MRRWFGHAMGMDDKTLKKEFLEQKCMGGSEEVVHGERLLTW